MAISTSANALGTYYLYQFSLGNGFPDYPKWGRWTNTWAQTMNNFGPGGNGFVGPEVCVYERAKLLNGDPAARQKCFQLHIGPQCNSQGIGCQDSLLPADIDSPPIRLPERISCLSAASRTLVPLGFLSTRFTSTGTTSARHTSPAI